jgi:hypothetical protein
VRVERGPVGLVDEGLRVRDVVELARRTIAASRAHDSDEGREVHVDHR